MRAGRGGGDLSHGLQQGRAVMGRGPGAAQRAILDALTAADKVWLTIPELAERTGRSERQVRTAVHGLEARELAAVSYGCIGWKGRGDYGRWVRADSDNRQMSEWKP